MAILADRLIRNLGKAYTVTRTAPGAYQDGVFAPGAVTSIPVRASVQPLNGHDIVRIPESSRGTQRYTVYTVTPIFSVQASPASIADRITIEGSLFEIESVENWPGFIKAVAVRLGG